MGQEQSFQSQCPDLREALGLRSLVAPGKGGLLHRLNRFSMCESVLFAFRNSFCTMSRKQAVGCSPRNVNPFGPGSRNGREMLLSPPVREGTHPCYQSLCGFEALPALVLATI